MATLIAEMRPDVANKLPILPAHIQTTVQVIARLHEEHRKDVSVLQRTVGKLTSLVGCPFFIGLLSVLVILWMIVSLVTK